MKSTTTKPWNSQKFSPSKVSYYVLASSLWLIATHIGPTFISKPWEIPPRGHFHSAITFSLVPMAGHQERKSITYLDMPRRTKWCSENWTVCVMIKMQINNLLIYFPIYQFWRWHYCICISYLLPSFPGSLHFRRENLGMRLHIVYTISSIVLPIKDNLGLYTLIHIKTFCYPQLHEDNNQF